MTTVGEGVRPPAATTGLTPTTCSAAMPLALKVRCESQAGERANACGGWTMSGSQMRAVAFKFRKSRRASGGKSCSTGKEASESGISRPRTLARLTAGSIVLAGAECGLQVIRIVCRTRLAIFDGTQMIAIAEPRFRCSPLFVVSRLVQANRAPPMAFP